MTPTIEMLNELLPTDMEAVPVRDGAAWDVRYKKGTLGNSTPVDKVIAMGEFLKNLIAKGVSKDLLQYQSWFKSQDGNVVAFPRVYVNKELTPRQQQAQQASSNTSELETVKEQLAQTQQMIQQLTARLSGEQTSEEVPAPGVF